MFLGRHNIRDSQWRGCILTVLQGEMIVQLSPDFTSKDLKHKFKFTMGCLWFIEGSNTGLLVFTFSAGILQ